jgi:hypothetical protein
MAAIAREAAGAAVHLSLVSTGTITHCAGLIRRGELDDGTSDQDCKNKRRKRDANGGSQH